MQEQNALSFSVLTVTFLSVGHFRLDDSCYDFLLIFYCSGYWFFISVLVIEDLNVLVCLMKSILILLNCIGPSFPDHMNLYFWSIFELPPILCWETLGWCLRCSLGFRPPHIFSSFRRLIRFSFRGFISRLMNFHSFLGHDTNHLSEIHLIFYKIQYLQVRWFNEILNYKSSKVVVEVSWNGYF